MKSLKRVLPVLLALGLGACVTPYQEPRSGAIATVAFSTDVIMPTDGPRIQAVLFMDPADCSVKRNLGGVEPGKDVRVRVAADREVAAEMGVTVTGAAHYSLTRFWQRIRECYILVSFRPIEEHVYQLAYREDADKCFVHVRDLGKEGTSPGAPVKVEHRIRLSGDRGTSDPHCLRLPPP